MKRLTGKLTYANVISTICLFLLLGGGAAFAASGLGKNTVGSKQLKKNAVTTAKLKKEAVTGAKIKKATLTGTQINLASLGTVPSAQTANSLVAPEPWHVVGTPGQPPFENGWKDSSGSSEAFAFYKDAGGVVHLRGAAIDGTQNLSIFRLPPGFRPASGKAIFPVISCECEGGATPVTQAVIRGPGQAMASRDGEVTGGDAEDFPTFDGVTFRAES